MNCQMTKPTFWEIQEKISILGFENKGPRDPLVWSKGSLSKRFWVHCFKEVNYSLYTDNYCPLSDRYIKIQSPK